MEKVSSNNASTEPAMAKKPSLLKPLVRVSFKNIEARRDVENEERWIAFVDDLKIEARGAYARSQPDQLSKLIFQY